MIQIPIILVVIVVLILLFKEYPFLLIPIGILLVGGLIFLIWKTSGNKIKENIKSGLYKTAMTNFFKSGTWLQALFIIVVIAGILVGSYFLFSRFPILLLVIFIIGAIGVGVDELRKRFKK